MRSLYLEYMKYRRRPSPEIKGESDQPAAVLMPTRPAGGIEGELLQPVSEHAPSRTASGTANERRHEKHIWPYRMSEALSPRCGISTSDNTRVQPDAHLAASGPGDSERRAAPSRTIAA